MRGENNLFKVNSELIPLKLSSSGWFSVREANILNCRFWEIEEKRNLFLCVRPYKRNNWWKGKQYQRDLLNFLSWVGVIPGRSLENIVKYASFCKEISPFCEHSIVLLVVHWTFWIRLICYWFMSSPREIHDNKWIWLKILFSEEDWEVWIENRGKRSRRNSGMRKW